MSLVQPSEKFNTFINKLKQREYNFYNSSTSTSPVVSIISFFFNAHICFEETYKSVIDQSFQNFEWIIVDDCSTEPAAISIFDSLPHRSLKIKTIYHQESKGLAAARNKAVAQAVGKYLIFLDFDNLVDLTYIEKCVLLLETHPELSFVNSYQIGFHDEEYYSNEGFTRSTQFIQQEWLASMLLYRKADFDALGGFDEGLKFYEDWERWLRAITSDQKGWTIPEYLCYYRNHSSILEKSGTSIIEKQHTAKLIQSQYKNSFLQDNILNYLLKRSYFDTNKIKFNFLLQNQLPCNQNSKKILCFFFWLEVDGANKFNLDLVTLLTKQNYKFTIATTVGSNHPWHKHFDALTPDIFHLPNFLREHHWLAFTKYIIESRQIDTVLIANSYIAYYFLPLLRAEFPHVAFVDFVHTDDPGWRGIGFPRISCQLSKFLDCQVVTSKYLAKYYQTINPNTQDKLRICCTNVDSNKWQFNLKERKRLRRKLEIPEDAVVCLFPARLEFQKRPLFLVDIVKELVNQSLPIQVVVLGNGSLLSQFQERIKQFNLDSVFHVLPPVEPEEMLSFYSAADILLLPTEYEGIAVAIYEAMAMQLPIVASDVGGQRELVTPETGFLVPKAKGGIEEVQEYLKVLTPLIQDAGLRHKVGSLARQRVVELFPLQAMAEQMSAIFAEALEIHKNNPQPVIDSAMAEEMLVLAVEYLHLEQEQGRLFWENRELWEQKKSLEQEKNTSVLESKQLAQRIQAMESSKFWKFRKQWFIIKRTLGLTKNPH
ncbi:MAG: glycosyltransferase [Kastovskya adunca ATA6-11-RM4]|jgi:glycosyltransferase involved in cell wall biosynthesis|nr:glycosyltransferase [Kastovskya adunca ATA6-11-RM4]